VTECPVDFVRKTMSPNKVLNGLSGKAAEGVGLAGFQQRNSQFGSLMGQGWNSYVCFVHKIRRFCAKPECENGCGLRKAASSIRDFGLSPLEPIGGRRVYQCLPASKATWKTSGWSANRDSYNYRARRVSDFDRLKASSAVRCSVAQTPRFLKLTHRLPSVFRQTTNRICSANFDFETIRGKSLMLDTRYLRTRPLVLLLGVFDFMRSSSVV